MMGPPGIDVRQEIANLDSMASSLDRGAIAMVDRMINGNDAEREIVRLIAYRIAESFSQIDRCARGIPIPPVTRGVVH